MKNETYDEEPELGGDFPGHEKHGCFSRSLHGRIYGGPEHPLPISAPEHEKVIMPPGPHY
jgi:hypothetical protein